MFALTQIYIHMTVMIGWLMLKLLFLYLAALLASLSFFIYLNGKLLPPHRTLQFPLMWRDSSSKAVVELEKGQRLGGNFYLGTSDSILEARRSRIHSNTPYDISLLLKYPDRPEIPDLGNLRINMKFFRRDGGEAGNFEIIRALRYESNLLRTCRDILRIPGAIWKDSGSERIERVSLIERLIDIDSGEAGRKAATGGRTGNDYKFIVNEVKEGDDNLKRENPIYRIELSISPLPPLHSAQLEVLANLSPLQHFLFYYRVPAAILIIGFSTSILWFLISIYALIETVKIIIQISRRSENTIIDLSEIEEMTEILQDTYDDGESQDNNPENDSDSGNNSDSNNFVSVQFPLADTVANFIGDLRQRRKPEDSNENDDEDGISIYSSAEDIEDQSVPTSKEA